MSDARLEERPIHRWFGLSYSSYLVLPRLALQAMPADWQARFVALLEEGRRLGLGPATDANYTVSRRARASAMRGKIVSDPWSDYRHGDVDDARLRDIAIDTDPDPET